MSSVVVSGLRRSFGEIEVLRGLDLEVADGEVLSVLGPSGCGKTTLLRIVAGFLSADEGEVRLGDKVVVGERRSVPARRRRVGYVPQEGALFPHLDVRSNILFGLPRADRSDRRLHELLELTGLPLALAGAQPHELSGGQQQRVALARALAPSPRVVLLDEPFSSLDTALRLGTGRAVVAALRAAGATALLVTHDQGEALSLADRVAVLRDGRVAQVDDPRTLYARPVDSHVAAFVGGATVLPGVLEGGHVTCALGRLAVGTPGPADGAVTVVLRHEQVVLSASPEAVPGTVTDVAFLGASATVCVLLDAGDEVTARVPSESVPAVGEHVRVGVRGTAGVHA